METFICSKCHQSKEVRNSGGIGYGKNDQGEKFCYDCIADLDRQIMIDTGHSRNLPLYLINKQFHLNDRFSDGEVSNWPGTLKFRCRVKRGNHNIARYRYDVWFNGPDGYVWHGVQIGEWTQICHCKRTKELVS